MKVMSEEELRIRLRRTVTNKFSTTVEPRFRKRLRERAFENKKFCAAVDAAVKELEIIASNLKAEEEL